MYNDRRDYDVLMEARVVLLTFERLPYRVRSPYHFHYSHTHVHYIETSAHHMHKAARCLMCNGCVSSPTDGWVNERVFSRFRRNDDAEAGGVKVFNHVGVTVGKEEKNLMKKIDAYLWHVDEDLGSRRSSLTAPSGGVSQFSKVLPGPAPLQHF